MSVRISPRRGWRVGRFGGLARANLLRREVLLDSKSFFKLTPDERLAVVAHELAHLKSRHSLFATLILVAGVVLASASLTTGFLFLPTVVWLVFFFLMIYYRRQSEYQADLIACRYVNPSFLVSALSKLGTGSKTQPLAAGLSHPPMRERIHRLEIQ